MDKPVIGLLVGGALGLLDGLAAFRTPEVRSLMPVIVLGSTAKGLITGLAMGYFAKRFASIPMGLIAGSALGLLLGFIAAAVTPDPNGRHYYLEIMLPGAAVGFVAALVTQKLGKQT